MIKKGLEAIVGKRYVLDDEPTLDAYGKDLSLNQPRRPSLVVKPKNGCGKTQEWCRSTESGKTG
jgi:hypothetical protein